MHLNVTPLDPMNDGWNDPSERTIYADKLLDPMNDGWSEAAERTIFTDKQEVSVQCGDTVLYRKDGELIPAVLIESAGDGGWLARDARQGYRLVHLDPASIATRLPRTDLLGEVV